ncbi:MAG: SBBP repeat-containing protein [Acidobacteria bacterium]|nr:SBBP repeat-containing protein [Acidobacteriota bacterium]
MPPVFQRYQAFRGRALARSAAVGVALWLAAAAAGQTLTGSVILRGSGDDRPAAIATDLAGNVFVAGTTTSQDFPLTNALLPRLPEPALRVSMDGRTFAASALQVPRVYGVAASADGRLVLAGSEDAMYRSTDGGATWTAVAGIAGRALAAAIDPTDPSIAWAVGQSASAFYSPWTWTIYKSTDGGASWLQSARFVLGANPPAASRIFIDPVNPQRVYAFTGSGVLVRTTDAGASWQPVAVPASQAPSGATSPTGFAIAPSQPDIAYATTFYTPLMKSTDGGATWQAAAGIGSAGVHAIAVDPRAASTVWLVNAAGVQKSTDGGASFQKVLAAGAGSWQSVAVSPVNSSVVFAGDSSNVYATYDGGTTWKIVASGTIGAVFATPAGVWLAGTVSPTVFLAKLDPGLGRVLFATYLGAGSVARIAVDAAGDVYVAGTTQSRMFPVTAGAAGSGFNADTAGFVAKVKGDGSALVYSTLLGGLRPNGLAVDASGDVVVVGAADAGTTVPVTPDAAVPAVPGPCTRTLPPSYLFGAQVQIPTHGFALKLKADASAYLYATYLAGSCGDAAYDVAVDSSGAAWIGGTTYSTDFPVTADAMYGSFPAIFNSGFVTRLSAAGDRVLYSTFVGGGNQGTVNGIALDAQGNVVVGGESTVQTTPGAYRSVLSGCPPAFGFFSTYSPNDHGFVMKFSPGAAAPALTAAIGGACLDYVSRVTVDSMGNIWMTGRTASSNFPTVIPLPGLGVPGGNPGFLAALDSSGSRLISSSIVADVAAVAPGPGGTVFLAVPLTPPDKSGNAALIGGVDASRTPAIAIDSIVNFGGGQPMVPAYIPFAIAPGQAMRLKGRGIGPATRADAVSAPAHVLPEIAGVRVTFNGIAAQLVSVQAGEIVCLAPFALDGATSAEVQLSYLGQVSNLYSVPVTTQNIDVFAVANPDGTANSETNPAPVESVVALYLTGAGQTNPPSIDGAVNTTPDVAPLFQPIISVNGTVQPPAFFGAAVGQVAGVMQVNLFVPDPGAGANDAVYVGSSFVRIWARR